MLRDKFAMAAMQEIMHNEYERRIDSRLRSFTTNDEMARTAYLMADAMMREREKQDLSGDPDNVPVKVVGSKRPVPPEIETPPIKYE